MRRLFLNVLLAATVTTGCAPDSKSGKGFSLPEGDLARGQETFTELQCHACHTVEGVTLEKVETPTEQKIIVLGGAKPKVQTYGDLVTSIVNPSHRFAQGYPKQDVAVDGESKMRTYNNQMTVQQLIDLVTFLESHYSLIEYDRSLYIPYY